MTNHQLPTDGSPSDPSDSDSKSESMPQFISGQRLVSLAALREKIETEFIEETANRADLLLGNVSVAERYELIREVTDYVLAVESIHLTRAERLTVVEEIYRDIFLFGPLSKVLSDETVTEITIDGPDRIHLRRGAADFESAQVSFDDASHLERLTQRILALAGTQLTEQDPILEVGVVLAERPVRLVVFGVPISPLLHINIRLHPMQPLEFSRLMESYHLDTVAQSLISRILQSEHGLMIVGDVGTGKTTLLNACIALVKPHTENAKIVSVERTPELRSSVVSDRLFALPPSPDQRAVDFGEQISKALKNRPEQLILDEIRFDESLGMWLALTDFNKPRCLWVFRGATEPLRLRTAFNMSVRRAQPGIEQSTINALLVDRLPFVILTARRDQKFEILSISEWQHHDDGIRLSQLWPHPDGEAVHLI